MKYGFGLIVLLMGVALLLYLQAESATTVITASKPARETAERVAGVGMKESFKVSEVEANGKVTALEITELDPEGPLAKMYALKVGDKVIEVGPFSIRDTDVEMLKAQLLETGARQHKLVVLRGGEEVELAFIEQGGKPRLPGGNLNPVAIPLH